MRSDDSNGQCLLVIIGVTPDGVPKSQQARAKAGMQEIWMAATRQDALVAFNQFIDVWSAKYPKAVEKLTADRDELLAFFDFPAEHWQHLRTTNPIESTFATVRHRTKRTRNCVSRPTFIGLAFRLIESAEQSWRKIRSPEKLDALLAGMPFKDGVPVTDSTPAQQPLAA